MRRPRRGLWQMYATAVTKLRWLIVVAWAVGIGTLVVLVPPEPQSQSLRGFASDSAAVDAELRSLELFGFPLVSRVALVQHDPEGLSVYTQAEAVLRALAVNQGAYDTDLLGALPVPNTFGAFPGSRETDTTIVTYLYTDPYDSFANQRQAAEEFAAEHLGPGDDFVGITGSIPARVGQERLIMDRLHLVEAATISAIFLITALTFRSLLAPIVTLAAAGISVVVTLSGASWAGQFFGVTIPADLRPLIVALLLGVVTDYCILFLSGMRHRAARGALGAAVAERATADFAPIVAVAAVTVAAGTASLVVAQSRLFSAFGPAMALTVVIGMVVSLTLVPALLAILGRRVFWPSKPHLARPPRHAPAVDKPTVLSRVVTGRRTSPLVAVGSVALLVAAAYPLVQLNLGLSFISSLPGTAPVAQATAAAEEGFAPGVVSPTELVLEGEDVGSDAAALREFNDALERQPGIAGVFGPGDVPLPDELGRFLVTPDEDAARYLVLFDSAPLGGRAIDNLQVLRDRLPALLDDAGLPAASFAIGGDTALSAGVVRNTTDDLVRITTAALAVNFLLLALFLRAVVAPLYLLLSSVLSVAAALGLTVLVFQQWFGHDGLTFYVPFAAAILLVSLGSDYNIFAVGHIWQLAARRPLRRAIAVAMPQSTRAITAAGMALAASFALLALVPLAPFQELAFAISVGILLDVFVVRTLLVPSLLSAIGPVSGWPSRRFHERRTRRTEQSVAA